LSLQGYSDDVDEFKGCPEGHHKCSNLQKYFELYKYWLQSAGAAGLVRKPPCIHVGDTASFTSLFETTMYSAVMYYRVNTHIYHEMLRSNIS